MSGGEQIFFTVFLQFYCGFLAVFCGFINWNGFINAQGGYSGLITIKPFL